MQTPTQQPLATTAQPALIAADPQKRVLGYLIDCCCFILAIVPCIGALAVVGYMLCRDLLFDGRSIGKKVMKLRVVDATTGQVPSTGQRLGRTAVMFIPFFPIVELIMLMTNPQKRRLGDQWTNCIVIDE